MKDEIKEILEALSVKEQKILLDYITNLQETYQNAINQSIIDHKYASKKRRWSYCITRKNR